VGGLPAFRRPDAPSSERTPPTSPSPRRPRPTSGRRSSRSPWCCTSGTRPWARPCRRAANRLDVLENIIP